MICTPKPQGREGPVLLSNEGAESPAAKNGLCDHRLTPVLSDSGNTSQQKRSDSTAHAPYPPPHPVTFRVAALKCTCIL